MAGCSFFTTIKIRRSVAFTEAGVQRFGNAFYVNAKFRAALQFLNLSPEIIGGDKGVGKKEKRCDPLHGT